VTDPTLATMTPEGRQLATLLPAVLVDTDADEPGRPLLRLLEVLAGPLATLERAVDRLAADPFVALASPEALPLLAELVGARLLGDDVVTNRRVVASTIGWRRRKGNLATLEQVLSQTTGWPVEADEGFRSLLVTQDVTTVLPSRGWTTLLWDPIAVADPLTRRSRRHERHPSPALDAPSEGEDVDAALRRLGAADSLGLAASPRTVDLAGWARPDGVVVRSSRVAVAERDEVVLPPAQPVASTAGGPALIGLRLDPGGADGPLAGRVLPDAVPEPLGLTPVHERPPPAPSRRRPELLTPTDLAADPVVVEEGDVVRLSIDGVPLIGRDASATPGPLAYHPPGGEAVLRFADGGRPAPGESWTLAVAAVTHPGDIGATLASAAPSTDPGEPNPVVLTARASASSATLDATAASTTAIAGAQVALRAVRSIGMDTTWHRVTDGTWTRRAVPRPPGTPVSGDAVVTVGGQPLVVRLLLDGDDLLLGRRPPDGTVWEAVPLGAAAGGQGVDEGRLEPGPGTILVPEGESLVLLGPRPDGDVGAWRLDALTSALVTVTVIDGDSPRRPSPRVAAAACVLGDAVFLHGGQRHGQPLRDLWQLDLAGARAGTWVLRRVREQKARSGGALLPHGSGLVRIGGAGDGAGLSAAVVRIDLSATRPRWAPLPELPLHGTGLPGTLHARPVAGGAIEALVWSDRVAPELMVLAPGAAGWHTGPPEPAAPNPPAEGEVVAVADDLHVTGPPPLPDSEVVLTVGGRSHLAFLPSLDPHPADQALVLLLDRSGSSERWYPPGVPARPSLRLGRNRDTAPILHRRAPDAPRIGAAGRLRWTPLTVRQAVLDGWDAPLALGVDDQVLLDPRLGRAVVHPHLGGVRPGGSTPSFSASYHVARGSGIGAGFVPPGAALPARWHEPPDVDDEDRFVLPVPPELPDADGASTATTLAVGPPGWRWGPDGAREVETRLDDALEALALLPPGEARLVGVIGSPRLPATTGVLREGATTSIVARERGGYPYVVPDGHGVSLSLLERGAPGALSDLGPRLFVTGLALGGALELAFTTGEVDLRWCDLGLTVGELGVRVAGGGHDTGLLRSTPAATTLTLRLYGCQVAGLDVPSWVQVIAAGCTFDAGDRRALAIAAAGARLRLRDCTVRGEVHAGVLEATSCAFAGALRCDRPDLGWLRRCVTPTTEQRRPRSWRSVDVELSFAEGRPTWPHYLVLDDNNDEAVLTAGEGGCPPGAHADRGRALTELTARTGDFLPLGLQAYHLDRSRQDTHRMGRRN
jgi:hypothetical protein